MSRNRSTVATWFAVLAIGLACLGMVAICVLLESVQAEPGTPRAVATALVLAPLGLLCFGMAVSAMLVLAKAPMSYADFFRWAVDLAALVVVVPTLLTLSLTPGLSILLSLDPRSPTPAVIVLAGFVTVTCCLTIVPAIPWLWPWFNRGALQSASTEATLHPLGIPPRIVQFLYSAGLLGVVVLWLFDAILAWHAALIAIGAGGYVLLYEHCLFPYFPNVVWSDPGFRWPPNKE